MADSIQMWELWASLGVKNEEEFRAKLDAAAKYAEQTGKRISEALGGVGVGGVGPAGTPPGPAGRGPSPGASSPNAPWPFGNNPPGPPPRGPAAILPDAKKPAKDLVEAGKGFGLQAAYVLRNAVSGGAAGAAGGAIGGLAGMLFGAAGPAALVGNTIGQKLGGLAGQNAADVEMGHRGLGIARELAERDASAAAGRNYVGTYAMQTEVRRFAADFAASGGKTIAGAIGDWVDRTGSALERVYLQTLGKLQGIEIKPGSGQGLAPGPLGGRVFHSAIDLYNATAVEVMRQSAGWEAQEAATRPETDDERINRLTKAANSPAALEQARQDRIMRGRPMSAAFEEPGSYRGPPNPGGLETFTDAQGNTRQRGTMGPLYGPMGPRPRPNYGDLKLGTGWEGAGEARGGGGDLLGVLKDIHGLLLEQARDGQQQATVDSMITVIR